MQMAWEFRLFSLFSVHLYVYSGEKYADIEHIVRGKRFFGTDAATCSLIAMGSLLNTVKLGVNVSFK